MPFRDLVSGIDEIKSRLALLDQAKVESVSKKMKALEKTMEGTIKKKQEFEGEKGAWEKKASDLFEICNRWDATALALPAVVTRLRSLKALHQQSGSSKPGLLEAFSTRI